MNRSRRRGLAAGMAWGLFPWALPACSQLPVAPLRTLTADDFRAARQRGVGYGFLQAGHRPAADMSALQTLGAGHVRLWVSPEREANGQAYRIPAQQLATLDSMLTELERRGVYTVLVCSLGEDARGELWRSSSLQASAVRVWQELAQRLHRRPAVAGFDIVNEPVPPGLNFAMRQDRWLDFAARVIEAVRAIDGQRVLIVESAPDATCASFENLRPLPFANLVYSAHSYAPFDFTHQGLMPELPAAKRYPETLPDGRSSTQALTESLLPVVDFARKHDAPIYIGEFSAPRWAPDGSAARYVADSIAAFDRQGWSWCYHEFRTWHGWDPEMASARKEVQTRSDNAPVLAALRTGLRSRRN